MHIRAKMYIATVLTAGALSLSYAMAGWSCNDPLHYACQLAIALVASGLKVKLPGILSTMSVSYVFVVLSMMEFSYPETVVVACMAIVSQSLWRPKYRPKMLQLAFNIASMAIAVSTGYGIYHMLPGGSRALPLRLGLAAIGYFLTNTLSIAGVVSVTEGKNLRRIWKECYFWSFPYYLVGGAIAGLISICNNRLGWQTTFLGLPVVYVIFRSYRLYLGRLESEKEHAQEIAALHLRTIEALALAIEAKDENTHEHLQRVQVYAVELGKKAGLEEGYLQALRAASILHDIGKLAVPEHIISKPGKLTPEEFEKMKIHPIVGAEILERVQFPYAVVPIVRAHHEKWNGTGYPDGLKGKRFRLGARMLALVDCLDALASDRQYRRALPLEEAMRHVASESGESFDPAMVHDSGAELSLNWEKLAWAQDAPEQPFIQGCEDRATAKRRAPVCNGQRRAAAATGEFLASIAAARQEVQTLYELTQDLGNSLSLHETLSVLAVRLKRLIPYDAHRGLRAPRRPADAGVCERREFPAVFVSRDSRGAGTFRVGGGE